MTQNNAPRGACAPEFCQRQEQESAACVIPSGQAGGGTGVAMITCSKIRSVARMSICSPDEANGSGPKWPAR